MIFRHIKSGNLYKAINLEVINATNAEEGKGNYVLYESPIGKQFVRQIKEFNEKFRLCNNQSGAEAQFISAKLYHEERKYIEHFEKLVL